jgi:ribosomal protein S18 acetylase RimI-like enzyme
VFIYIDGFGQKRGDCGVVAESGGVIVGAAWTRIIPAFGHLDDATPELAISVSPDFRGKSVGGALMARLFELLRSRGFESTSLAVQKQNAAVRFYRRLGYEVVGENDEDFIMRKGL